jgi:hypothetical protein
VGYKKWYAFQPFHLAGMHVVWRRLTYNLAQWSILLSEEEKEQADNVVVAMEALACAPKLLLWPEPG